MTTEALTTTGPDLARADVFFDRPPIHTDWDAQRAYILAGKMTSANVLTCVKALEPMMEHDYRDLQHWKFQQILRLCLLHEEGLPMLTLSVCDTCGERQADPLFKNECLHCRETARQLYHGGSRGSCSFLRPVYNPRSHAWGLLYYWSWSDDTFMFWLADFYKSRHDAEMALMPLRHYEDWLDTTYNGMVTHWHSFENLVPLEEIMTMKLPLNPEEFRALLRTKIGEDMDKEQQVMKYYVESAMREHEREQRDR